MGPLELFFALGGPWLLVLGFFVYVAHSTTPSDGSDQSRFAVATSKPWFGKWAAAIAAAATVTHFVRLSRGGAFVPGTGNRPWIHTASALLALAGIALSLYGYRGLARSRPWLSLSLVLVCIVGANWALEPAPKKVLSYEEPGDDPAVVAFVQARLAAYGCFAAAGENERTDGEFDATTQAAINSFQLANGLLTRPTVDRPYVSQVRPSQEFRLLTQPFPWLGTVGRCQAR